MLTVIHISLQFYCRSSSSEMGVVLEVAYVFFKLGHQDQQQLQQQ